MERIEKGGGGPRDTLDSLRDEVNEKMLEKRLVLVRDIARDDGLWRAIGDRLRRAAASVIEVPD